MEAERKLSADAEAIFREGIGLVLSRWSALQLAVDNEWGGRGSRQKAEQLAADAFSWFTQSAEILYIDDLEDILNEAMISLNTMTEDGSIEEVAEKLMFMYEDCLTGNFNSVESLREANHRRVAVPHVRQNSNHTTVLRMHFLRMFNLWSSILFGITPFVHWNHGNNPRWRAFPGHIHARKSHVGLFAYSSFCLLPYSSQDNEDDDDDDDNDNEENDGSSSMMVDTPESQPNLNPADATSSKPTPKPAAKAEDGWEVVGPRRNRGKRN
ncbi:hypothetical protein C1H46_022310 [Malus baccata]|uniref:Pre-rRNA-processing protein TSR2 homolog n=1 Tax=Malus baccata TaxID=106549 RepID=A0A540M054_MALBA|nr:hypothetical protein C1H46_022310 [Malus baccata]